MQAKVSVWFNYCIVKWKAEGNAGSHLLLFLLWFKLHLKCRQKQSWESVPFLLSRLLSLAFAVAEGKNSMDFGED